MISAEVNCPLLTGFLLVVYDIPSDSSIKKFTITKEMVEKEEEKTETKGEYKDDDLLPFPNKSQAESA